MATRQQIITRAKVLINENPDAGRRKIASDLRAEFGRGLRDAVILGLQRQRFPEKGQVAPYQFAKANTKEFRPLRQGRYNKLVKANFTRKEALALSKLPLTSLTFHKDAAKSRKQLLSSLKPEIVFNQWSKKQTKTEMLALIKATYDGEGWTTKDGDDNPYNMLRAFRKEAIAAGKWNPLIDSPWRKKKNIRDKVFSVRWKGDTEGQKSRYRKLNREAILESKAKARERKRTK